MWQVSVIVSTFNRSEHLRLCIAALEEQTRPPDEVVIADDGSNAEHVAATKELIRRSPLRIVHAWQENSGFRLPASRNNAVRRASGDYLFFTDGDVLLFPDVLERHLERSGPKHWVSGYAIWLTRRESRLAIEDLIRPRCVPELWPPPGDARGLKLHRIARRSRWREWRAQLWPAERFLRKVMLFGVQASMPREAFEKVNGFDEAFHGWGYEDKDLGLRLQLAGYRGCNVFATGRAVHLWHPGLARGEDTHEHFGRRREGQFRCRVGLAEREADEEP